MDDDKTVHRVIDSSGNGKSVQNYSSNPHLEGRVLILSMGGTGIENSSDSLQENLRQSLDLIPYLKDGAGRIDYLALVQKDSTNLTSFDVAGIAETIHHYQNDYDGYVIIAGMDTLPYVSAATSFALRGLGAPVVFTGTTMSAHNWDSDFRLNLPNAIKTAVMGAGDVNAPSCGETCIIFDDTLSRATAAINRGTRSNNPIITPRIPKIGDVGWTVKFSESAVPRKPSQLNYSYNTNVDVAYFDLVSETHVSSFEQLVEDDTLRGIVMGAFGAGNIPTKLIPSIYKAVYEKGKVVGVITNNKKGSSDMGHYDVGAAAVKAGAISLGIMTKAAAVEKMRYALNNAEGETKMKFLQDAARLLLTTVAEEMPDSFSRHAVRQIRDRFTGPIPKLEDFYKPTKPEVFNTEIKTHCKSKKSKYKILAIGMGGTYFQEPNIEGSLIPTKRTTGELFELKLKNLERLASLDYAELANLDSTDMEHFYRAELAKFIAAHKDEYDGFVVMHGTDTLAYSASSLSYMLLGFDKDVVFTGSQKPGFTSSDFDRNFIRSIKSIIARLESPEKVRPRAGVKVAFGDKLMLGSTVIKEDEHGINAFAPVEKHPLAGTLSHHVELNDVSRGSKKRPFTLFTDFDSQVAYFECISAIDIKQFEAFVENPEISGILIGAYDDGNMPTQMKYYIATAVNSYNKPVAFVATTDNGVAEIKEGASDSLSPFIKAGGIAMADTIKESGFQKLCFAMGLAKKEGLSGREKIEFVRQMLHTNFTGELSPRYTELGGKVYQGIFGDRNFSDDDIQKALTTHAEKVAKPSPKASPATKDDSKPEPTTTKKK